MAGEKLLLPSSVQKVEEEEHRGGEGTGAAAAAGEETAAAEKQPEHGGDQEKAAAAAPTWKPGKRKRIIQEHLQLTEEAIAKLTDESERAQMVAVAASLRRQEATADQDELDCTPRPMAPGYVASLKWTVETDYEGMLGKVPSMARFWPGGAAAGATALENGLRKSVRLAKEHATWMLEEYEAKGYIHHYQAEDFDLPPNYFHLLAKRHES